MEEGRVFLGFSFDCDIYCIGLKVDQALDCCDDSGFQVVPGIGRGTLHTPNYLVLMGSGNFISQCLIVGYLSFRHPCKFWGVIGGGYGNLPLFIAVP